MSNWTSYGLIPLVEGFVGWFTNSLAGQMIFYPIKWRGLPLFRIEGERTVGPNRLAGDAVHRQGQPIALATMALAGSSWRQSCHSWYTCVQVRPDIKHIRLGQPLPGPRTGPSPLLPERWVNKSLQSRCGGHRSLELLGTVPIFAFLCLRATCPSTCGAFPVHTKGRIYCQCRGGHDALELDLAGARRLLGE